ncbi:MAG: hypothetical protein KGK11_13370 [Sphingomonadales bacterium]|nr:hypothetical protein [Sphingomonadales bacterium]
MATVPIGGDAAPVTLPGSIPPMPAVARILGRYDRPKLAAFIEVAIGLLDTFDAPFDPDEPDFATTRFDGAPGDPVDSEEAGDDEAGAYAEWQTMPPATRKAGALMVASMGNEDDEDGDADCALDEGEPDFARYRDEGAGCAISDPGGCDEGY